MVSRVHAERAGRLLHVPRATDGPTRRALSQRALGQEDVRPRICHNGPLPEAEKAVNAVRAALAQADHRLGAADAISRAADDVRRRSLRGCNGTGRATSSRRCRTRRSTPISPIRRQAPSVVSGVHLYPIDGAVHRRKPDATAWNYRDVTWSMGIVAVDPDPAKTPALKKWARDYWQAVHPFNSGCGLREFHDGR